MARVIVFVHLLINTRVRRRRTDGKTKKQNKTLCCSSSPAYVRIGLSLREFCVRNNTGAFFIIPSVEGKKNTSSDKNEMKK